MNPCFQRAADPSRSSFLRDNNLKTNTKTRASVRLWRRARLTLPRQTSLFRNVTLTRYLPCQLGGPLSELVPCLESVLNQSKIGHFGHSVSAETGPSGRRARVPVTTRQATSLVNYVHFRTPASARILRLRKIGFNSSIHKTSFCLLTCLVSSKEESLHLRVTEELGVGGVNSNEFKWMWVKIKPPGIGLQVLVIGSIYRGTYFGYPLLTHSQMISFKRPFAKWAPSTTVFVLCRGLFRLFFMLTQRWRPSEHL